MKQQFLGMLFDRMHLATIVKHLDNKKTRAKLKIDGREYPFLFHSYNNMGLTERTVEMPIIYSYLATRKFKRVLEVGNVTNYYEDYFAGMFPNKTVVDKIEHNYNVITSDIADYNPGERFDFIFSISTFEHMDSDLGRNPDYRPGSHRHGTIAADNIVHCYEKLLEDGGLLVITAPLGYTPEWDLTFKGDCLDKYPFKGLRKKLFRRVGEQEWVLDENPDLSSKMHYGYPPYPYANYVAVVEINK